MNYWDMLPEGCIAEIVSHTTPLDACRVALVSPAVRSVADSDPVWDKFLPPDYRQLIARAVDKKPIHQLLSASPSKKDLYLSLAHQPLLIDAGDMVCFFLFVIIILVDLFLLVFCAILVTLFRVGIVSDDCCIISYQGVSFVYVVFGVYLLTYKQVLC